MPHAEQHLPSTCRMAALYSHLSEHIHEFERTGTDAVIIWRELVNAGQADTLECLGARVDVPVQRGFRMRDTHAASELDCTQAADK
jgi:hypothetical protein